MDMERVYGEHDRGAWPEFTLPSVLSCISQCFDIRRNGHAHAATKNDMQRLYWGEQRKKTCDHVVREATWSGKPIGARGRLAKDAGLPFPRLSLATPDPRAPPSS